jgi:hypothetical protein
MRIVRYETLAISDNVKAAFGFNYCIEIPAMLDFHEVRVWLTKTYGEGHKFVVDNTIPQNNDRAKWSYKLIYQRHLIYFLGDAEFAWFKLKFGEHDIHRIE